MTLSKIALSLAVVAALGAAFAPRASAADGDKREQLREKLKDLTPEQKEKLKERLKERLSKLTPEQREKLKEKIKERRAQQK